MFKSRRRFFSNAPLAFFFVVGSYVSGNCEKFFFISDLQLPISVEKLYLKAYRNEEARDILLSDIIRQNPRTVFMLGDLVSTGSSDRAWRPIDRFCQALRRLPADAFVIPGNHEYLLTAKGGLKRFRERFPEQWLYGYCVAVDSVAVVMLNSNVGELRSDEAVRQHSWFLATMDSLDVDPAIKTIIVCTHHAPFTNSTIVAPSDEVAAAFVPRFETSKKAKLFVSGHSHNLECFKDGAGKRFAVIGGGGGIWQPLYAPEKRKYVDVVGQEGKPLYFYFVVERTGKDLKLIARGLNREFKMVELPVGEIGLDK